MEREIPKVIHYCWFGGNPLPELAQKCIASWKRYLPDYEIHEWNESNFDVYRIPYTAEAYHLKKYAYVSDYARFWILFHYGGIYFDTDVEVIRPLDDIIARGSFLGFECQEGTIKDNPHGNVAAGLGMGICAKHPFFGQMVAFYDQSHYIGWNGKNTGNVVGRMTQFLDYAHKVVLPNGVVQVNDLLIYPTEYFCPYDCYRRELHLTDNSRTIHHYMASWAKDINHLQAVIERIEYIIARIYVSIKYFLENNNK